MTKVLESQIAAVFNEHRNWYPIYGSVSQIIVRNPSDCDNFSHLDNQIVQIGDSLVKVLSAAASHEPPFKAGEEISLMVHEKPFILVEKE